MNVEEELGSEQELESGCKARDGTCYLAIQFIIIELTADSPFPLYLLVKHEDRLDDLARVHVFERLVHLLPRIGLDNTVHGEL